MKLFLKIFFFKPRHWNTVEAHLLRLGPLFPILLDHLLGPKPVCSQVASSLLYYFVFQENTFLGICEALQEARLTPLCLMWYLLQSLSLLRGPRSWQIAPTFSKTTTVDNADLSSSTCLRSQPPVSNNDTSHHYRSTPRGIPGFLFFNS